MDRGAECCQLSNASQRRAMKFATPAETDTMTNELIDRRRLYHVGNLSIFLIGLGFAVRANIAPNLQGEIYDKIDVPDRGVAHTRKNVTSQAV